MTTAGMTRQISRVRRTTRPQAQPPPSTRRTTDAEQPLAERRAGQPGEEDDLGREDQQDRDGALGDP